MTAYNFTLIDTISPWSAGGLYVARAYFDVSTTSGGAGFANSDTVTATSIIPADGVEIYDVWSSHPELDTNTTPTLTYSIGDSGNAARFISNAPGAVNGVTTAAFQMRNGINIITTTTSGVISSGAGYVYTGTSPSNLIMTITNGAATAATSGIVHLMVLYRCVGNS